MKKIFGSLLIVVGVGLATYNLLHFSSDISTTKGVCLPTPPSIGCEKIPIQGAVYYYTNTRIQLITLGATMITAGLLVTKKWS